MIISAKSVQNFFAVNGFLIAAGFLQYYCVQYISHDPFYNTSSVTTTNGLSNTDNLFHEWLAVFAIFISRNYLFLTFLNKCTQHKPSISVNPAHLPVEQYPHEFDFYVMQTTAIETATHFLIKSCFLFEPSRPVYDVLYLVPFSFCFDIVFDFFHYISHRLLHHKYLYKYSHKLHHKFKHPTTIITFYQDPLDLVLTNSVPTAAALFIITRAHAISYLQFHLLVVYKMFIEIGGHLGKKTFPTSSFCQFIWLPKLFHIELYTEDHDLHHSASYCNFSKRFSLWDKVFGTYKTETSSF